MTLAEILVGTAVFVLISLSVYQSFAGLLNAVRYTRVKVIASNLANEQFEIARNMPYADVGILNGVPVGRIPHIQTLTRDGTTFTVTSTVRAIDDPFDGTIGAGDTSFAPDSKLLEVVVTCGSCRNFVPITFTTWVGPKSFESFSNNGALLVNVFDANGIAVSDARVQVANNLLVPAVSVDDVTNNSGQLLLTDVIPSNESYKITVTKNGYSADRTYTPGDVANPNPQNPDVTVVAQQLTQKSFTIDRTGTINVTSARSNCTLVPSIDFSMKGSKIIGTDAGANNIYKYTGTHQTNGSGVVTLSNLEWDTYAITLTDASYDLSGTMSPLPFSLAPNSTQNVMLIVLPKDPERILISVKDSATGLPATGAGVNLDNHVDINETLTTGRGFLSQTDWIGGSGQTQFVDETRFDSSDGNIETALPLSGGELRIKNTLGFFAPSGMLESSTFNTGGVSSNYYQMLWNPTNQPNQTSVKFQFATSNDPDEPSWQFKGPDGTGGTYYTTGNQTIWNGHNNERYARYRAYLETSDNLTTPSISDVFFTFTSSCVPPGQVFFTNIGLGTYTLTVTKVGYQVHSEDVVVDSSWRNKEILLVPQ